MSWFFKPLAAYSRETYNNFYAANLDGSTSYITLPSDAAFNFANAGNDEPFTISFWANPTSLPFRAIARSSNTTTHTFFINGETASGRWQVRLYDSGGQFIQILGPLVSLGEWQHVTVTYDGSNIRTGLKIYLNGVFEDGGVGPGTPGTYDGMTDVDQIIIGQWKGTASTPFAKGLMDEVAIFKGVEFTQAEVTEAYGGGIDDFKNRQVKDLLTHSRVANLSGYYRLENGVTDSSANGLDAVATSLTYRQHNSFDIYLLIGGQSNAVANTLTDAPTAALQAVIPRTFIYTGSAWENLDYPGNNEGDLFGIELPFGYEHSSLYTNVLNIAKVAQPSTPIAQAAGDDWNVNSNELIVDLVADYTALYDKAIADGVPNPKMVLYWNQGENDARILEGGNYYDNFVAIKNALDAVHPLDLIIVCPINEGIINTAVGSPAFTEEGIDEVRAAQFLLATNFSNIEAHDMNAYILGSDDLHYQGATQEQLGENIFTVVNNFFS